VGEKRIVKLHFTVSIVLLPILTALTLLRTAQDQESPLDAVLKKMDTAAAGFRTTRAEFEWDRYEKVIDEVDDIQSGTIYYRRTGKDVEMKLDIIKPDSKYVLFSGGKFRVYMPKPDQVTVYDAGKNRADFENYLVLGFGGSGQDMVKAFDVTYVGPETIEGVATAKLQLVPKSEKLRTTFKQILLWIDVVPGDVKQGISVQQQFFEPQGDYRLAKYSAIKVNEKIGNDVFQIKTTGKTQTITPRG
jgi:outer membrane lipoprotein-sorting protein